MECGPALFGFGYLTANPEPEPLCHVLGTQGDRFAVFPLTRFQLPLDLTSAADSFADQAVSLTITRRLRAATKVPVAAPFGSALWGVPTPSHHSPCELRGVSQRYRTRRFPLLLEAGGTVHAWQSTGTLCSLVGARQVVVQQHPPLRPSMPGPAPSASQLGIFGRYLTAVQDPSAVWWNFGSTPSSKRTLAGPTA